MKTTAAPNNNTFEKFINELRSQSETVQERNGISIFKLKREIYINPDNFRKFLNFFHSYKNKPWAPQISPKWISQEIHVRMDVPVDLKTFHINRLRSFFRLDTTKEDAAESIHYLLNLGWNEKDFQELGISRSNFYRYQNAKKKEE